MSRPKDALRELGGTVLGGGAAARGLWHLLGRSVLGAARGRFARRDVFRQAYQIGNRSFLFVALTLGFIGMVLVFQTGLQINRLTGDLSRLGADWGRILVHEFGPTLTAMMLATRVAAGIAAEIGSMTVTEQVDALRMCGVDPIDYLIVPRFVASIAMTVTLTALAVVVALAAGTLTAHLQFGVNPRTFIDLAGVQPGDLIVGLGKCVAYGAAMPVVAGFCGLRARGGSEGVGEATTRAVIGSSFAVIVLDFVLSGVGYFFLQQDPGS